MPDDPDPRIVVERETRRVGGAGDLFQFRRKVCMYGRYRECCAEMKQTRARGCA
jgi:hypothetical protein